MRIKYFYGCAIFLFGVTAAYAQIGTLESTFQLATVSDITVPYQNGTPVPSFEKQPRTTISLAGQWKKLRFAANHNLSLLKRDSAGYAQILTEAADRQSPYYDDALWQQRNIPGAENTINANEKVPEYYENGIWYRTKFSVGDSLLQKFVKLNFYAVNYIADVWLNGKYLGWHEGGFTPFSFDVSSAIRSDSANILVVRVDNIPWGTRKDIVPFYPCDWFNYAGILHDVYLEVSDKISVIRADMITKNINGLTQATVVVNNRNLSPANVDVTLRVYKAKNDSVSLAKEISADLAGGETAIQGVSQQTVSIPAESIAVWQTQITVVNPELWSPKKPNLYILKVTVSQGGAVKDEFFTQFGVRTIQTADDKILLNGKTIFLHGVARHEDHPVYGRSIPTNVIISDLKIVKSVNANYLRSGHYPNHPFTFLAADRLGLLVMEEIPVWWFDEALPWAIQNVVRKIHVQMFREMVFRDRNRSSIGLWSTSNECKDVAGRITFLQSLKNEVESQYPDGRLLTQSAAADRPGPYDQSQEYCDVAGWTMYFGIFYNPYGLGKYRGTRNFMLDANDYFPKKPIIATEYGYWSGEDMSQFAKQVEVFDSTFYGFSSRLPILANGNPNPFGFIAGVTWWCIFDWYTHQQAGGYQSMGLVRMNRDIEKPVFTSVKTKYGQYINFSENITDVEQTKSSIVPKEFSLTQNFPNPFNPSTVINYQLPGTNHVSLKVYDILGKEVITLVNEVKEAGSYSVPFNSFGLSTGVYFYRLQAGSFADTKKMAVVK
ncbi:MAG: glycoside hydrolase family 2 TIM barrel-domain containing protein [Bacteroidota bacterium]|nr:glycoside hydrolase family 2 TIM barrel-domain containing protein [Bacteroidota bacterium]